MKNLLLILIIFPLTLLAQTGIIRGKVINPTNNDPVSFATVQIQGTSTGSVADFDGKFEILNNHHF